jgi:hypothetical protein
MDSTGSLIRARRHALMFSATFESESSNPQIRETVCELGEITKKVNMTKAAEDRASGDRDDSATDVDDSLTSLEVEPEVIAEVTGVVVGARPTYWKLCSENERYRWFLVSYVVTQLGE